MIWSHVKNGVKEEFSDFLHVTLFLGSVREKNFDFFQETQFIGFAVCSVFCLTFGCSLMVSKFGINFGRRLPKIFLLASSTVFEYLYLCENWDSFYRETFANNFLQIFVYIGFPVIRSECQQRS